MSQLLKCLATVAFVTLSAIAQANSIYTSLPTTSSGNNCNATDAFSAELDRMDLALSTTACDAHLQRKLKDYLGGGSRSTERMLGRANQYFPVFEHYLAKHGMPESLKYLAIAESMLVPRAVSSARAAGLWQLMPVTAREMGLRVDGVVDERLDLHRATEAAVVMLKKLHLQFGDWHLALAAYNCGPGRVRRAIRAAGGYSNYTKVKRFLPRESQRYVAAYVAAAYTVNYYDNYGLTPADHLAEDSVASLRVYRQLNLRRMAKANDLSPALIRKMNPSFVRGYVPRNKHGYRLRVPLESKWTVQEYIWGRPNLVKQEENDDVDLAAMVALDMGLDIRSWYLGCKSDNLRYEPSIAQRNQEAAANLDLYYRSQAVAMN